MKEKDAMVCHIIYSHVNICRIKLKGQTKNLSFAGCCFDLKNREPFIIYYIIIIYFYFISTFYLAIFKKQPVFSDVFLVLQ